MTHSHCPFTVTVTGRDKKAADLYRIMRRLVRLNWRMHHQEIEQALDQALSDAVVRGTGYFRVDSSHP